MTPRGRIRAAALLLLALGCGDGAEPAAKPSGIVDPETQDRLEQLGYVDWGAPAPPEELARSGVTVHDPTRTWPGVNLFTSVPSHEAHLIDMQGRVLHTWRDPRPGDIAWHHVEVNERGDLFGLGEGPLRKVDWDSALLWESPVNAHHDLEVQPSGRIYVLGKEIARPGRRDAPIVDNLVVVLDADGKVLRREAFSRLFGLPRPGRLALVAEQLAKLPAEKRSEEALLRDQPPVLDVFHANSIQVLDRDVPGLGARGDVLVSVRNLDGVFVLDLDEGRVVWGWGPRHLQRPHHAVLLSDGSLSIFDNGWFRKWSRVLRVDPRERRVVWHYPPEPDPEFFSIRRGAAQHLPNGNVLVTESERGHVFEIDPAGEIVWEFWNPEIDAEGSRRAQIYRMRRLDPAEIAPLAQMRSSEKPS